MKSILSRWGIIAVLVLAPATAFARQDTPEREVIDARLEGYTNSPALPKGSEGLTWVSMIVLGVLCCGGLFKDAKRSHLD